MEHKLKKILSLVFNVDESTITSTTSVDTIKSWDSINHMNLILAIEQNFKVAFNDEEIIQMLSFEIILEILKEKNEMGANF